MSAIGLLLIKALAAGTLVCTFAAIGELLRPRGLAGIFAAAPSVALASLAVTVVGTGTAMAALSAAAMVAGAAALCTYCLVGLESVKRFGAMRGSIVAIVAWLAVAIALWAVAFS